MEKEKRVTRAKKSAFTLVELLVVIAIIGILIGMLLPAVQMVRESARRTTCSNNLRQVNLAIHNYESAFKHLPSGINAFDADQFASMTWLAKILPYVEQQNLWDQAVEDYDYDPSPFLSHLGMRTPVNVFSCPSDPESGNVHWTHENRLVTSTDYLGVNGTNHVALDGVMFLDSETKWADVSDGQSNTLIIGERPPSPDFWYGWWYAGYGRAGSGSPDMLLGVAELNADSTDGTVTHLEACPAGPYSFEKGQQEQCDTLHFWRHHPGGGHFGICDGSVQFVSYRIDRATIEQLSTRAGGEVAAVDW